MTANLLTLTYLLTLLKSSFFLSASHNLPKLIPAHLLLLTLLATLVFTALHVMQTRYSEENSIRPSVRPSVRHARDPWQNGREICPDFYTIRKNIYLTFLRRRMVGGGRPLLGEILGQPIPIRAKSPIFNQ